MGPKLSWKKVWTIFTKVCLTIYNIFTLFSVYVNDINKKKMLLNIFKHHENFFLPKFRFLFVKFSHFEVFHKATTNLAHTPPKRSLCLG